jgi:hypothetical protein
MKNADDIQADLVKLVEAHYYSEDYELEWAAKRYYDDLTDAEQITFEGVMLRRLTAQPGIADVSLCARLGNRSLTPFLAALLDRQETSNAMSRALLAALAHQPDEQAYPAVERFLDSEQEGEALLCLSRMNFHRTVAHLRWAIQKDHLHNFCIHAFHEQMKHAGMDALLEGMKKLIEPDAARLTGHVKKILTSKSGPFNPFSDEELELMVAALI